MNSTYIKCGFQVETICILEPYRYPTQRKYMYRETNPNLTHEVDLCILSFVLLELFLGTNEPAHKENEFLFFKLVKLKLLVCGVKNQFSSVSYIPPFLFSFVVSRRANCVLVRNSNMILKLVNYLYPTDI